MDNQYTNTSQTLVMRRFFKALEDANLLAAELWADHENFADTATYCRKLDKLVWEDQIPTDSIEWLLNRAITHVRVDVTHPGGSYGRGERKTWRGWACERVDSWRKSRDEQKQRCARLVYQLRWATPDFKLLQSDEDREFLLTIATPAEIAKLALQRRYIYEERGYTQPHTETIEWLIARNILDLSHCGTELVDQYTNEKPERQALALRLIQHRDTSKPMPEEFVLFIRNTIQHYQTFERLRRDLPHLLRSKTNDTPS